MRELGRIRVFPFAAYNALTGNSDKNKGLANLLASPLFW